MVDSRADSLAPSIEYAPSIVLNMPLIQGQPRAAGTRVADLSTAKWTHQRSRGEPGSSRAHRWRNLRTSDGGPVDPTAKNRQFVILRDTPCFSPQEDRRPGAPVVIPGNHETEEDQDGDLREFFSDRGIAGDTRMDRLGWDPRVDVIQRGNDLIVHADLPGMTHDDVVVEVSDGAITISAERQQEHEEDRGSVHRVERSYGAFFRTIPLPEGAIVDWAKANFKDDVLEVTVPAPPEQVSRGRWLKMARGDDKNKSIAKDEAKTQS